MPKIKVYKHDGKAIPVDRAKESNAFECPFTGKIYISKRSYLHHLKNYRDEQIRKRIRGRRLTQAISDFNNLTNWKDVVKWIETNSWVFLANAKLNRGSRDYDRWPTFEDFFIKIHYLGIKHYNISNTHHCPRDGITNWYSKPTLPRSYPGYGGTIQFELSHSLPCTSSDLFKGTGIHIGTGGAWHKSRYRYSVCFFDSDWPGFDKERVLAILSEKELEAFTYGEDKK